MTGLRAVHVEDESEKDSLNLDVNNLLLCRYAMIMK
jgi:hypothetical protein